MRRVHGGSHALAEYSRGVEAFAELALSARRITEDNRVTQEQNRIGVCVKRRNRPRLAYRMTEGISAIFLS
jgi:hypothetical protein